jgi:hypothetical protein
MSKPNPASFRRPENLILTIWRKAMQSHPVSARRRRWTLILVLIFASAAYVFQAPADINLFVKYFFSARNYGHFLALGMAFWLTFRAAAGSHRHIFGISDLSKAQSNLRHSAFNGNYPILRGAELVSADPSESVIGPGKAELAMGVAAVLEPYSGNLSVISSGKEPELIGSFEQFREIIDLRDQVATFSLWGRTRDGIRVQVQSAKVVYSIHRAGKEASLGEPHPFDERAALSIAYGQRIESSSQMRRENSQDKSAIINIGSSHFERQLQRFIAEITLGELLASSEEGSEDEDANSGTLLLARDILRRKFLNFCLTSAKERGLDIQWVDLGTWKVDELAQEIIDEFHADNAFQASEPKSNPYQDSRSQELNRLFTQLVQMDEDVSEEADEYAIQAQLIGSFYGIFDGLKLRYGELPGEDEKQIDIVLRFLKVLNKDLEQKQ